MKLSDRIREARKSQGLSQEDLAIRMGLTQGAVSQWERGETYPALDLLTQLAIVLCASTDWLLGLDDSELSVSEMLRKRRQVSGMTLVKRLSAALEEDRLTSNQIELLANLLAEFAISAVTPSHITPSSNE